MSTPNPLWLSAPFEIGIKIIDGKPFAILYRRGEFSTKPIPFLGPDGLDPLEDCILRIPFPMRFSIEGEYISIETG